MRLCLWVIMQELPNAMNLVAPDCGSWGVPSRGTSLRSYHNYLGMTIFKFVSNGNLMISRCLDANDFTSCQYVVCWRDCFSNLIPQYIPTTKAHIVLFGHLGSKSHLRIGESSGVTHVSSPSIWILGQPRCLCPSLNFGSWGVLIHIKWLLATSYLLPAVGAWGLSSAILAGITGSWYAQAFDRLVKWQVDFSPRHGKTMSWKEESPLQGTQNHPLLGSTKLDRMHAWIWPCWHIFIYIMGFIIPQVPGVAKYYIIPCQPRPLCGFQWQGPICWSEISSQKIPDPW